VAGRQPAIWSERDVKSTTSYSATAYSPILVCTCSNHSTDVAHHGVCSSVHKRLAAQTGRDPVLAAQATVTSLVHTRSHVNPFPRRFQRLYSITLDMGGLDRTSAVDSLLSRFRPAASKSILPTAVMVAPAAPSPISTTREIVPRNATQQDTRSQAERRARADAGDLQARLDLIPLHVIEDQLSRCFRTAQPNCSILDSLRGTDESIAVHLAASTVLEELADSTEQAALTSALVYRYIQAHSLWKGHPDPRVTSAETFLDTLENSDYVKANIVIGSSADLSKQRSLKIIEEAWGSDWFDKIPQDLRDPRWMRAEECSKRLLAQVTLNARRGYSLDKAIDHWTQSMRRRTDEGARREHRISLPRSRHIILDDVRSLNERVPDEDSSDTSRARHATLPDSPKDDRLRVELWPAFEGTLPPQKKPDFSTARPSRPPRKRKRKASEAAVINSSGDESGQDADGWRVVADGKEMVKRVKNSLVRKPIEVTSSEPQPSAGSVPPSAQQPLPASKAPQGVSEASQRRSERPLPTCDGLAVALLLHKFIDAFHDMPSLDNDPKADHRCCETCRPKVLKAFKVLEEVLKPCAEDLEDVGNHRYANADIDTSQISDISPLKHGLVRKHTSVFVTDSSDED
jgi:hypothetical protein